MQIQKCPECKPIQLWTVVRLLLILMTLTLAYSFYAQVRDANHLARTKEYSEKRVEIFQKIHRSVRTDNLERLQRMEKRYSAVQDPEFIETLNEAKANVQEKIARKTFAAGKGLDTLRQRESRHSAAIRPVSLSSSDASD